MPVVVASESPSKSLNGKTERVVCSPSRPLGLRPLAAHQSSASECDILVDQLSPGSFSAVGSGASSSTCVRRGYDDGGLKRGQVARHLVKKPLIVGFPFSGCGELRR